MSRVTRLSNPSLKQSNQGAWGPRNEPGSPNLQHDYKPTLTLTYLVWRLQALERLPRTQRCVWCLRVQARLPRPALRCVAPRLDALPRAALVLCLQALERLPRTPALRLVPAGASAPASASAACPRLGYGRRVWCLRVMARLPRPPAPRMVSARAGAPASTRAVLCCTALRRAALRGIPMARHLNGAAFKRRGI